MSLVIKSANNIFKTQFSNIGGIIVFFLGAIILALSERILYDMARFVSPKDIDYIDNISVISVQAVFVVLFLVVALLLNFFVGPKAEKYAVALFPYFIVSIILIIQLAFQVSVYFYNHHTNLQFYVVMTSLVLLFTYIIYIIQKGYNSVE